MLVPGGFGQRGVEGMVLAAKYCRQNGVPYLGICLGLQVSPCSKWHPSLAYVSKLEGLPGIWTMAMPGLFWLWEVCHGHLLKPQAGPCRHATSVRLQLSAAWAGGVLCSQAASALFTVQSISTQ